MRVTESLSRFLERSDSVFSWIAATAIITLVVCTAIIRTLRRRDRRYRELFGYSVNIQVVANTWIFVMAVLCAVLDPMQLNREVTTISYEAFTLAGQVATSGFCFSWLLGLLALSHVTQLVRRLNMGQRDGVPALVVALSCWVLAVSAVVSVDGMAPLD